MKTDFGVDAPASTPTWKTKCRLPSCRMSIADVDLQGRLLCQRTLISPANQSDTSVLDGEAVTDAERRGGGRQRGSGKPRSRAKNALNVFSSRRNTCCWRGETSAPDQERRSGKPSVRAPACCSQGTCLAAAKPRSAVAGRAL
jgi:hypothetical protein